MPKLTLGPWNNYGTFCRAQLKVGNIHVYDITVNTRTPQPGQWTSEERRCHTNRAVTICSYIGGLWQASRSWPLKATAVMLAEMGASPDDLEAFFKAAADMEWEEALILEARRAANALVGAPESPAYLVIRLLSGVLEYEYLPTLAEAQQAVADHCGVETTDLQSTAGIPWGAVFSATNGDKYDAWAFPVHDSGENIADLSTRLEVVSQHRWQLWEAFHTAAARLRVHGLEVPGVDTSPPGTGCPYCGSHRTEKHLSAELPFQVCRDCRFVSPVVCPECGSTDITYTWTPDRSPTGFVRRQTLAWQCHTCGHEWNQDEAVDEEDSREVTA